MNRADFNATTPPMGGNVPGFQNGSASRPGPNPTYMPPPEGSNGGGSFDERQNMLITSREIVAQDLNKQLSLRRIIDSTTDQKEFVLKAEFKTIIKKLSETKEEIAELIMIERAIIKDYEVVSTEVSGGGFYLDSTSNIQSRINDLKKKEIELEGQKKKLMEQIDKVKREFEISAIEVDKDREIIEDFLKKFMAFQKKCDKKSPDLDKFCKDILNYYSEKMKYNENRRNEIEKGIESREKGWDVVDNPNKNAGNPFYDSDDDS